MLLWQPACCCLSNSCEKIKQPFNVSSYVASATVELLLQVRHVLIVTQYMLLLQQNGLLQQLFSVARTSHGLDAATHILVLRLIEK